MILFRRLEIESPIGVKSRNLAPTTREAMREGSETSWQKPG